MNLRFASVCNFRLIIVIVLAFATQFSTASQIDERREKALKGIEACLRRNEVSSRECKNLNKDVQILVSLYKEGDKTVLPTLLRFTYLSEFYDEALIADPEGFLSTVSRLSEPDRYQVAFGIAAGMSGMPRPRFEAVRATLEGVADTSPNYALARICLQTLESENASFVVDYFPPQTFRGWPGGAKLYWFSREFYVLGEKPLWPQASGSYRAYRITVLGAFGTAESVTLTVGADGSGQINYRAMDSRSQHLGSDETSAIRNQEISDMAASLDQIQFWQMPTEAEQRGFDGAQWILEAVQDGKYHIVVRWCPGRTPFGAVGRTLFHLAGHKLEGEC